MKKTVSLLMALVLFLIPCMGTASGVELIPYDAAEAALTISMPADWYVFTTHMQADDPALAIYYDATPEGISEALLASNLTLKAMSPDFLYAISISFTPYELMESLTDLNDANIEILGTMFADKVGAVDIVNLERWDTINFGGIPAFRQWLGLSDGSTHSLNYITIHNYTQVSMSLVSYTGEPVNEELTAFMDSLIATAVWDD